MTQEEVIALVIDAIDELDVVYMIAGSFASNYHGAPRMTQDADLVVELDEEAAMRLVRLLDAEFYVSEDAAREAVALRRLFNAIHLASGFKVDLVVKKDRPFSDSEMARRIRGTLAGRSVHYASAEDTVLAKLEWSRGSGSDRQFDDASAVLRVQSATVDWPYLERWADELGVRDLLERARNDAPG